jgi:hypothetical protein
MQAKAEVAGRLAAAVAGVAKLVVELGEAAREVGVVRISRPRDWM